MWTDINKKQPTHHGAYTVFGTVNKGTEHETKCMFTAYWCEQSKSFTDKDGEDLTGINEGVKFWFDFSKVADPIIEDIGKLQTDEVGEYRIINGEKVYQIKEETDEDEKLNSVINRVRSSGLRPSEYLRNSFNQ